MLKISEYLKAKGNKALREAVFRKSGPPDAVVKFLIQIAKEEGDRIVHDGKVLWAGLGNPSGLHSFADTLISEKWTKSGGNFEKKLTALAKPGAKFSVLRYYNITRDRGKWVEAISIKVEQR